MLPQTTLLCNFSGPLGSQIVCCFIFENSCPLMRQGLQWCGIFHYHWWTASIKLRLLSPHASYASWGLSLFLRHKTLTCPYSIQTPIWSCQYQTQLVARGWVSRLDFVSVDNRANVSRRLGDNAFIVLKSSLTVSDLKLYWAIGLRFLYLDVLWHELPPLLEISILHLLRSC